MTLTMFTQIICLIVMLKVLKQQYYYTELFLTMLISQLDAPLLERVICSISGPKETENNLYTECLTKFRKHDIPNCLVPQVKKCLS